MACAAALSAPPPRTDATHNDADALVLEQSETQLPESDAEVVAPLDMSSAHMPLTAPQSKVDSDDDRARL